MAPGGRGGAQCGVVRVADRLAHRQRRGPGAPVAIAEEEHCTVERRVDLSYAEFIQQYVRPPILPHLPRPKTCPEAPSPWVDVVTSLFACSALGPPKAASP